MIIFDNKDHKKANDFDIFPSGDPILNEGFGSWLKRLASGDIESEVIELEKELRSGITTPEEQKLLLGKVNKALDIAITLKYNKSTFRAYVFKTGNFFSNIFKTEDEKTADQENFKELDDKLTNIIQRLSKVRDSLLNLKFEKDPEVAKAMQEELRRKAKELIEKASGKKLSEDDF